jgi:competence protein CoiA
MIWALVENEKIEAKPRTKGICPICKGKVFSKCGNVNVWHWAHFKDEECDTWYEHESIWHKHWKMTFGKENAEIRMEKDEKFHIADILTNENVVIELQNSPILKPIIRERENFYGERMIWLINGIHFKNNFKIRDPKDTSYKGWLMDSFRLQNCNQRRFHWSFARKSWKEVQRNVFIDFGDEFLFWIKEGMGMSSGFGSLVIKENFIKKYGGNFEYYSKNTGFD